MSALTGVGRISAIRAVHVAGAIGMGMSTRCCVGEEGEEAEGVVDDGGVVLAVVELSLQVDR